MQYFAAVREIVGSSAETLELPDHSNVGLLLRELEKRHGQLRDYIYDAKTGKLRPSIQFLIGDIPVPPNDGLSTELSDGAVFAIIPPVGGG